MNRMAMIAAVLLAACAGGPPLDNPGASARSQDRSEARALEEAEQECTAQGKHAEARRVEGETIYNCVD